MKVILTQEIENLGIVGDLVEVKPGYARNFLLPRKFALPVNAHNMSLMKSKREKYLKQVELEKLSAEEQKIKIESLTLTFKRKAGENEVLFGSVTVADIESELAGHGIEMERKKFHLPEPIKKLGKYTCSLRIYREVEAELKIEVLPEGELEKQENKEEAES